MPEEHLTEVITALRSLVEQAADSAEPVTARLTASVAAAPYLEALTRNLVNDAREHGASWEDIAHSFGTTPANVKARFGSYRSYDDDE
jgi:hypothetical protein